MKKSTEPLPTGNPDNERRGFDLAEINPESATDPGPKNPLERDLAPSSEMPPSTDRGDVPNFWFPFSRSNKRLQEGGWARQVTVSDLPISTTIAGVNMRLIAGAIREMHWHQASEWAIMLYGHARITCIDPQGRSFVNDVKEGDLWYFPSGYPHSIQGLGPDGCEFLLIFDDGQFSENETFLISDWMAHTPVDILAKNFGWTPYDLNNIPQRELYIFPGTVSKSLEEDIQLAAGPAGSVPQSFSYSLYDQKPNVSNQGGEARVVDSNNFPISTQIAAALVTLCPGAMRELHWHPNADEWLYIISGKGRITVFSAVGRARTMDFGAGDVGYIPKSMGHYIENTGDTDMRFLETFKSSYYASISLAEWMALTPPELVEAHTNIKADLLSKIPKKQVVIVPE
ncbi:cupin domain-containing protein [Candidatus Protochlamydia phocaeensis]|uniref:cupin domain-containing protein n=1 Tax=Candidatus Protochlamydia phocaeensis TaxID=1414722 RepID=UPI0008389EDD|nr:cupin domain-containing protein [Candidatus Protochlamydia phocaeensis]